MPDKTNLRDYECTLYIVLLDLVPGDVDLNIMMVGTPGEIDSSADG